MHVAPGLATASGLVYWVDWIGDLRHGDGTNQRLSSGVINCLGPRRAGHASSGAAVNVAYIKQLIINDQRQRNVSLAEAAEELVRGLGLADRSPVDAVVEEMREEARHLESLRVPGGVEAPAYREAKAADARELHWYTGPRESDRYWGHLRRQIEASSLAPVLPEIDAASTKVVAHFADPGIRRLKKKGLVLGYVQSGKTANYAAVAAKSADAGYRLLHSPQRTCTTICAGRRRSAWTATSASTTTGYP